MVHKHFILTEESCEIIRSVMVERNLKTETSSLEYILSEFLRHKPMAEEIAETLHAYQEADLKRILSSASSCAKSAELLLDMMNTLLVERGYQDCYPADEHPSVVLSQAKEAQKKRVSKAKQKKDNRKAR